MNRLAQSSRLLAAASVTAKRAGDSNFTSASNLSAITEKSVSLEVIEATRKKIGATKQGVAEEAGINVSWYRAVLANPERASAALINRLADALRRIRAGQRLDDTRTTALIEATYGGFLSVVAPRLGVTAEQVRATNPRLGATADVHWRTCAQARQAAIYLTNTSLGVPQRAIARTVGLTEAAVCLAVRTVEDRRDDPAFDRLLDQAAVSVTGRMLT